MFNPMSLFRSPQVLQRNPQQREVVASPFQMPGGGRQDPKAGGWNWPEMEAEEPQIQAPPQSQSPYSGMQDEGSRYFDEISRIRKNAGPSLSAYQKLLAETPDEQDYRPSKMTRLAAGLGGISAGMRNPGEGINVARQINRSPYNDAMEQYKNKLATTGSAAKLEQDDMQDQLKALSEARALGLKFDEFKMKNNQFDQEQGVRKQNADAATARAKAYAQSVGTAGIEAIPQEDGSVVLLNKSSGKKSIVPMKTIEAAQLGVNRQNAGTASRNAETNEYNAISERGRAAAYINRQNQLSSTGKTLPPTQQAAAIANSLRILKADPRFSAFIEKNAESGAVDMIEDDGSPAYKIFLRELDRRVKDSAKGASDFSDEELDEDEDPFDIVGQF